MPVDPGLFALSGLGQLQEAVAEVRRYLDNGALRISGLVLTRAQKNNVSRDVEAQAAGPLRRAGPPGDHPDLDEDRGGA